MVGTGFGARLGEDGKSRTASWRQGEQKEREMRYAVARARLEQWGRARCAAVAVFVVLGGTLGAPWVEATAQGLEGGWQGAHAFSTSCVEKDRNKSVLAAARRRGGFREVFGTQGSGMFDEGEGKWSRCGMVSFSTSCVPREDDSESGEEGRRERRDDQASRLETGKCGPVLGWPEAVVVHAFSAEQMAAAYRQAGVALVVGHGVNVPSEQFDVGRAFTEVVPVFVTPDVGLDGISTSQLEGVLSGEIVQWSELGSALDDNIRVYLHGGELQKPKFEALMRSRGINLGVDPDRVTYGADYRDLRDKAVEGGKALAIGLRSVDPEGLRMMALDGKDPKDTAANESYPWVFPVYVAKRRDAQGEMAERLYMGAVEARQERDLVFAGQ